MYSLSGWFWIWDNQCFSKIVLSVCLLWEFAWNILFKPPQRIHPALSRGKCNTPVYTIVTKQLWQTSSFSFCLSDLNVVTVWFSFLRCDGDEWSCRGEGNTQCIPLSWVCDNRFVEFSLFGGGLLVSDIPVWLLCTKFVIGLVKVLVKVNFGGGS